MQQDSKINAERHDLLFGDQQKPKQIQKHIPHKNIKKNHTGWEMRLFSGGRNTYLGPGPLREALIKWTPVSMRGSGTNEGGREAEAVGPMIH